MERGKFIVIDGTDGSGKATQLQLLSEKLEAWQIPYATVDFPQYEGNVYGELVGRYLKGEFGGINEVSPYLAAPLYAGDRLMAKPLIEQWLEEGKMVAVNRYVSASMAHMSAKLPPAERPKFWDFLESLEYQANQIPREDLVIVLYVPPKINQLNVDHKGERNYLNGQKRDLHESNLQHLQISGEIYLHLAQTLPHWKIIQCVQDGEMRSREEINQEIVDVLKQQGILKEIWKI